MGKVVPEAMLDGRGRKQLNSSRPSQSTVVANAPGFVSIVLASHDATIATQELYLIASVQMLLGKLEFRSEMGKPAVKETDN